MPASNGSRGGHSKKKGGSNAELVETLKGACPEHKIKDLDKLVKAFGGNEEKIRQKIAEWWEEPAQKEEIWEDVSTKGARIGKKQQPQPGRGGRSDRGGRGRGYQGGRGGPGGRGGGGERRERGRGRGPLPNRQKPAEENKTEEPAVTPPAAAAVSTEQEQPKQPQPTGVPMAATASPVLKGAWSQRAGASVPSAPPVPAPEKAVTKMPPKPTKPQELPTPPAAAVPAVANNASEVGIVTTNDPTPAGLTPSVEKTETKPAFTTSGNVWATKGSAHLIRAEKPMPVSVPAPPMPVSPITPAHVPVSIPMPMPTFVEPEPEIHAPEIAIEHELPSLPPPPPGAWGAKVVPPSPAKPEPPQEETVPIEIPSSPAITKAVTAIPHMEEPGPVSPKPSVPQVPVSQPSPAAPANVLNMGRWETRDDGDLDFDFGFNADDDANENTSALSAAHQPPSAIPAQASSASPARPPPGLSIGGMPPMPANAVLVHELENNLEAASLDNRDSNATEKHGASAIPSEHAPMPSQPVPAPLLPAAGYGQYGMGVYNYNTGNGFMGAMHGQTGPVLASGVVPQQQQQQQQQQQPPQPGKPQGGAVLPGQPGLYGSQHQPSGNAVSNEPATNDNGAPSAGIPPGMQGAMPAGFANPVYYGQHQFHMGQPQAGLGYNYGYGAQFNGVNQAGFGYQQVMGQNGGYGAPAHYPDDQGQHQPNHSGGSSGYQKNSGGNYRGRNNNNHHNNTNNNQYQNHYNPQQHAGYGGQPYGMAYPNDHFNQQRGGYPSGMAEPYANQSYQSHSAGGFQDDEQKGKKGGGQRAGNGSSLQQQFQGQPHQLGGHQGFGLQGQGAEPNQPSASGGGGGGGAGGWSNQSGWSGGANPSWQGS